MALFRIRSLGITAKLIVPFVSIFVLAVGRRAVGEYCRTKELRRTT